MKMPHAIKDNIKLSIKLEPVNLRVKNAHIIKVPAPATFCIEPSFNVNKLLSYQLYQLKDFCLYKELPPCNSFRLVTGGGFVEKENFLEIYRNYIKFLMHARFTLINKCNECII
ncbi:hypothetical protein CAI16_20135 [Virgibacillus dokdonensis]|uniref:Uncharacterized protein n=1 Tax=Virgibacillus dokdonensis TaxID=302167 RepID=A0A3E0WHP0_9BACI|nr:hypothetical protein CAI16_20135 [Virgibacillus dokdonensis]